MSNILVVSHGNLANEMIRTAHMIMGEFSDVDYLSLKADDHVEQFYEKIKQNCEAKQTLILVDLAGGSPFIQASRYCYERAKENIVEVVAGVNLAMLIECISLKDTQGLKELKEIALRIGTQAIKPFETN